MITIAFNRDKLSVTVKGHANSGEVGHDLVCSAVSILAYTLAADVERMGTSFDGEPDPYIVRLDSGNAEITCTEAMPNRLLCQFLFESVCVGYEMLSRQYPKFVSYSIVEG